MIASSLPASSARKIAICAMTALVTFSASPAVAEPCNPNAAQCHAREKLVFTNASPNLADQLVAAEIYMMNPDGSDPVRLTDDQFGDGLAALSPDGKGRIVFDSNRIAIVTGGTLVDTDLFLIKAHAAARADEPPTSVTRGSSATWAPDGKNIAFHRSASGTYGIRIAGRAEPGGPTTDSDIFVMNLAVFLENLENPGNPQPGAEPVNLTRGLPMLPDGPYASDDADWSPDGRWIAFTSRPVPDPMTPSSAGIGALYTMNIDLRSLEVTMITRLTLSGVEERSPAWSPDGKSIVLMRRPAAGQPFEIWVLDLNVDTATGKISEPPTVAQERRLTTNNVGDLGPSWSPSGDEIVFQRIGPPPIGIPPRNLSQLWIMNSDGTNDRPITGPLAGPTAIQGQNLFVKWGRIAVGHDALAQ